MLPSRPPLEGPFARCVREAAESVTSPAAAEVLITEALRIGALQRIPEEVQNFRAFCEGPLRRSLRANVAQAGIELIFEHIGNVLFTATNDARSIELARHWSEPAPSDRDGDSGVRNVEVPASARTEPDPRTSAPGSSATLGRMRAVTRSMADGLRAQEENVSTQADPRSEPYELPPHVARAILPSAVLVVSLDAALVREVREGMAQHAPVRAIGAAGELVGSLVTSGERVVILIDTALPSIAISTFAGLVPVLPSGTRVVLWGASRHQLTRLNALYPTTAGWIAREGADDPVALLLTLPDPR